MINLNQLRAFYYVAKHSSHTIAAEKLFISQPAVTAQIKLFENFHDMKLFKKTGRRLILTHLGELLFEQAERIFKIEDEVENILSQMKELNQGLLELGCTKAYAKHIMPSIISIFHRAYPKIKISLQEGNSMTIINSLLEFENEIAVVAQMEVNDPRIKFIPFSMEEIVIVLPVNHPLKQKKEIEFQDIEMEPVIIRGKGSGTRKKIMDLYNHYNATPNILMESNNTEFIMDFVEGGDGISFLVKPSIEKRIKEKKLISRSLKNTKLFLNVSFAYIKNTPLSYAAKAFFDVFKNSFIEETCQSGVVSIMAKILAEHPQNE
ncbi:LysR family transcriptional regulator [Desulfobacula phenolica]|uniref:DNA-binding transcriptional regulator, LysR family n=1 Tax=Desulfobacula phenolica TaxID=90732 RepID=A0A1H2KC53_9BACT|nr:LysR family transcriptional regulator [Desulfobacula phenolica]SDU66249.1 DNA-binding transcriptional regulator, LysR family [Desulfobacula phenolica]